MRFSKSGRVFWGCSMALASLISAGCKTESPGRQSDFSIDLGTLLLHDNRPEEWIVKHDFFYTNEEDRSIRLKVGGASCGCMVGKLETEVLEPGEKVKVSVSANLPFDRQRRSDTVFIESSSVLVPKLTFTLVSDVFLALTSKPNTRNISIPFDRNGAESISFELIGYRRFSDPPVESITYVSSLPSLRVLVGDVIREKVGDFERFKSSVKLECSEVAFDEVSESIDGTVRFFASNGEFESHIHFWRRSPIVVEPGMLLVSSSRIGQPEAEETIVVLRSKTASFRVLAVECSIPALVAFRKTADESLNEHRFSFTLDPNSMNGSDRIHVTFLLDMEDQQHVTVPVYLVE